MKKIAVVLSVFITTIIVAQENHTPKKFTQNSFGSLDYISAKMPNDEFNNPEENMGLAGVHYNLWLNNSIYTGVGFYGSVHGKRGGLFTLGVNAGFKTNIINNLFLDTGFHFGGGGGAGAPDCGGAFILPHLNLGLEFEKFSTTLGYSSINFFDKGNITSNQIRLGLQIPISYDYTKFSNKEKSFSTKELKGSEWDTPSSKSALLLHLNNYVPKGNSQDTNGNIYPSGTTIRLAGLEYTKYLKNNWFLFFKADGAFHGIDAGYMDIFLGGGYQFNFNQNRTRILTKFAIGAGGGGGVETQGGFLIHPDLALEQKIFNSTYLSFNKGYIMTPNAFYKASTFGIGLKYNINSQGLQKTQGTYFSNHKIKGIEIIIKNDVYFNAQRRVNPDENLHQIALQVNLFATNNIYLAGQTSFASFGNAGAYAEGIVGVGYQSNPIVKNKIQLFTQVLAGAAGGGHISTGQGLIVRPSVGFNLKLNEKLSFRSSFGKVKARKGALNSTSFTFGLNYRVGFLTSN